MKPVLEQQVWLGSSLLAAWLVLSLPMSLFAGNLSLLWLAIAAGLCFLPGCVVLILQPFWKSFGVAGFGAMAGMVLRMVVVLAGLVAVSKYRPDVSLRVFGIGLSVFYLVSLVVETLLVVRGLNRAKAQSV